MPGFSYLKSSDVNSLGRGSTGEPELVLDLGHFFEHTLRFGDVPDSGTAIDERSATGKLP
jgi:hypothetical protein